MNTGNSSLPSSRSTQNTPYTFMNEIGDLSINTFHIGKIVLFIEIERN